MSGAKPSPPLRLHGMVLSLKKSTGNPNRPALHRLSYQFFFFFRDAEFILFEVE
jgi:hypothetical protein